MLCRNPFMKDGAAFGCGQCEQCRFNRRRTWAHRIMLEAMCHADKAFVSLSYSELYLPALDASVCRGPGNLVPKHMQDWLKRIRRAVEPAELKYDDCGRPVNEIKLRYYGVGEYGDKTWRPHFHVVLYGYPTCVRGLTLKEGNRHVAYKCCDNCALVQATWPWGDVVLGSVTAHSASYCAEYTVKKMTAVDDKRLDMGNLPRRHPEFCRMSLRPGIGCDAMWEVASKLMEYSLDEAMVDVPSSIAYGRKHFPIGRYLRGKLRENIGRDKKAPKKALDAIKEELRPLREASFDASTSFRKALVSSSDGRVALINGNNLIFKRRFSI